MKEKVPVVFRRTIFGNVVALLPTLQCDDPDSTVVYLQDYGLSTINTNTIMHESFPATEEEYKSLLVAMELTLNCEFMVYQKILSRMIKIRNAQ